MWCSTNLKSSKEVIISHNREVAPSSTQSKEQSFASILSNMEKQMQLKDRGNGEYLISWKNKQEQLQVEREEEADIVVDVVHTNVEQTLGTSLLESESHATNMDLTEDD